MKDLYKLAVAFEKMSQNYHKDIDTSNMPSKNVLNKELPKLPSIDPYIQMSLNNLGYQPELKVDGILGTETSKALEWFKQNFGLTPTTPLNLVYQQVKNETNRYKGPRNQLAVKIDNSPSELTKDIQDVNRDAHYVNGPAPQKHILR